MDVTPYDQIKQFIFSEIGLTYYRGREDELRRRIDKAIRQSNAFGYREYLKILRTSTDGGSKIFDDLVSELTVGETHFFRDEALFRGLKDLVLPTVIERNQKQKRLWIWSAGCATGEEVYTIVIVLKKHFEHLLQDWDIRIAGTDINRRFLHRAVEGVYTEWSFRGTPPEIREECFVQQGKMWHIKPEYKRHVVFHYHNLMQSPFPSVFHNLFSFDIIFCRNVMIYLDGKSIQKLSRQFHQSLVPDGWLIVGHADHNVAYFGSFDTVMVPGTSFYRNSVKTDSPQQKPVGGIQTPFFINPSQPMKRRLPKPKIDGLPSASAKNRSTGKKTEDIQRRGAPKDTMPSAGAPDKGLADLDTLVRFVNQGHWDDASLLCKDLLSNRPLCAEVHLLSAFISEHNDKSGDALESLKKALYLDPTFVIGHYHMGLLFQKLGDLRRAEKRFANVISLLKGYPEDYQFELADGISALQLRQLSDFNLEVIHG